MKLTNREIAGANQGLGSIFDQPLKGKVKFKAFQTKKVLEEAFKVVVDSLQDVDDPDEQEEILDQEQNVNLVLFTQSELEDIDLSLAQLAQLQGIIELEE